jgi:Amt family ammonium transporter
VINDGDTGFVLVSAALVMVMTPGLAFFYGGLVRRKNFLEIMLQSFISMGVVTVLWVLVGYSLAFSGNLGGVIGNFSWAGLRGVGAAPGPYAPHIPALAHFIFQEMFAIITPALITGAFADRVAFKSYLKFLVIWSLLVYVPIVHWIWGGGFLMKWGVEDFAGGMVVHTSAGFAALASVFVVGSRKFAPGEKTVPHNVAFVGLGTGLLWFGWFGFNGGSAFGANSRAAMAITSTHLAASAGAFTWMVLEWRIRGKPSVLGMISGAVAGLGTITPASGFVMPMQAVLIGVIAGAVCFWACTWLKLKLGYDDSLDVFGVHGIGGLTGTLLAGVLAVGALSASPELPGGVSGLLEGNPQQVLAQLYGIAVTLAWSGIMTFIVLKIVGAMVPLRVRHEDEVMGLDVTQHGEALQ